MAVSPPRHRAAPAKPYARPAKTVDPFYLSRAWRKLRAWVVDRDGHQCTDPLCKTPNRGFGGYLEVDHIVEISDGGAPLDPGNCLTRCRSCHKRKTEIEKAKRRR